jgi:hypothetical protein
MLPAQERRDDREAQFSRSLEPLESEGVGLP